MAIKRRKNQRIKKSTHSPKKKDGWVNKKKTNMNSGGGNTVNSVVKY